MLGAAGRCFLTFGFGVLVVFFAPGPVAVPGPVSFFAMFLRAPYDSGVTGDRRFVRGYTSLFVDSDGERLPEDMLFERLFGVDRVPATVRNISGEIPGERFGVRPCPAPFGSSGERRLLRLVLREGFFRRKGSVGDTGRLWTTLVPNGLHGSLCSTIGGRKLFGGTRLFLRSNRLAMDDTSIGIKPGSISVSLSNIGGGDGGGVHCVKISSNVGLGGGVGGGVICVEKSNMGGGDGGGVGGGGGGSGSVWQIMSFISGGGGGGVGVLSGGIASISCASVVLYSNK